MYKYDSIRLIIAYPWSYKNKIFGNIEKVGITNVNLSKMKTGKISAIRFSTLAAICDTLHCQPGDILEYDPDVLDDATNQE